MSRPRLAVLVHGGPESIEAVRARGLTQSYPEDKVRLLFREGTRSETARRWQDEIRNFAPDLLYVINTALPGVPLACSLRLKRGLPFILDTGDAVFDMAWSAGTEPAWKLPLLWCAERLAQRLARTVVVRGTFHRKHLLDQGLRSVALIRDGCAEAPEPDPAAVAALRTRLGLDGKFVVGVMGSLVFSPRLKVCYGWDLLQALALLSDLPIHGLIIGDGNGRAWMEAEARRLGVAGRVSFTGRIPYAEVPTHLRLLDVALSTQTDNLAGRVRTTGKLPEYLAAGRFVLASRVGEATLLLPEIMQLEYSGAVDRAYPQRLAARLRQLIENPALLDARNDLRGLAEKHFSYAALSRKFNDAVTGAPV